jgi:predicted nuclease of predicted toxin-antitoxin system
MKFLIDENLPYRFSLWKECNCEYVFGNPSLRTDKDIWDYSKDNNLVIVTKDADFSELILINEPPPKVIHIKIGNMKMKELHFLLNNNWEKIESLILTNKLLNIYHDRIEVVK